MLTGEIGFGNFLDRRNYKSIFSKYMGDVMFVISTPLMLQKIVTGIDELELEGNIKGDFYEYLLSELFTSGTNG